MRDSDNGKNSPGNRDVSDAPIPISEDMLEAEDRESQRIDFEKGISYFPLLSIALILVNILVFIWEIQTGALESQEAIIRAGALTREKVLNGEVWRLITAIFLHGGPDHLIGNCIILYILGMACEHAFHFRGAAVIYFISGLCGSLLSFALQPGPSVGASGAIFGVMGSVILFLYKYQNYFFVRDKRISFVLAVWAGYQIIVGFMTPYVDNFAHIGGLVGGIMTAFLLEPRLLTKHS